MRFELSLIAIAMMAMMALALPAWAEPAEVADEGPTIRQPTNDEPREMQRTARSTRSGSGSRASDIGYRGWGLRVGLADDIDQLVGGVHFNLGEFVPHLRFQPDVQLGAGDDHTTLYVTAPAHYRFGSETRFTPYAGGGVSAGLVDRDKSSPGGGDDTEFEVGIKITGGLEWPRPGDQAFLLELSLGFGDVHDATILAGWSF